MEKLSRRQAGTLGELLTAAYMVPEGAPGHDVMVVVEDRGRDYLGGGNCYPPEVGKLIHPNDFSALLPTPEAVISDLR